MRSASSRHLLAGLFMGLLSASLWAGTASAQAPRVKRGVKVGQRATATRGSGPDLKVNKVVVTSWEGGEAKLNIYLGKQGAGQVSDNVEIAWVDGRNRKVLKKAKTRFAGGRDGFMYAATVKIPGDGQRGHLEVVGGTQGKDPSWGNNTKTVSFKGRTDLTFDGRPKVVQKGGGRPNREYILTVRNVGKRASSTGCKVEFKITETGPERTVRRNLPSLRPGAKTEVKVPYHFTSSRNSSHNTLKARIVCAQDLGAGNNTHKKRLN